MSNAMLSIRCIETASVRVPIGGLGHRVIISRNVFSREYQGMPIFLNHDHKTIIGRVESAVCDGEWLIASANAIEIPELSAVSLDLADVLVQYSRDDVWRIASVGRFEGFSVVRGAGAFESSVETAVAQT